MELISGCVETARSETSVAEPPTSGGRVVGSVANPPPPPPHPPPSSEGAPPSRLHGFHQFYAHTAFPLLKFTSILQVDVGLYAYHFNLYMLHGYKCSVETFSLSTHDLFVVGFGERERED